MMQSWARSRPTETGLKAILNLSLFGDHLAGPQRESELHLQQILLRHGVKDVHAQSETARRRTAIDTLHMSGDLD